MLEKMSVDVEKMQLSAFLNKKIPEDIAAFLGEFQTTEYFFGS